MSNVPKNWMQRANEGYMLRMSIGDQGGPSASVSQSNEIEGLGTLKVLRRRSLNKTRMKDT